MKREFVSHRFQEKVANQATGGPRRSTRVSHEVEGEGGTVGKTLYCGFHEMGGDEEGYTRPWGGGTGR